MAPLRCTITAIGLLLAGCATAPDPARTRGDVALTPVEPPDAQRHEASANEEYEVGELLPDTRRNPDYPAALLARPLPELAQCVELSISPAGRVEHTRILADGERCPTQPLDIAAALQTAIDAAVLQWEFLPSYVCKRPFGVEDDGYCEDDDPTRIAIGMLRGYRFVFTQTPDGPRVGSDDVD